MKNPQLQRRLFDKLEGSRWSSDERYFSCYCPFDSHSKPAFLVYSDGYTCLSCGTSGSIDYLSRFLSKGTVNFIQKPRGHVKPILPRWSSWQKRYGDIPEIARNAHRMADEYNMRGYFKKRKINHFFEAGMFGWIDGWTTYPVMNEQHEIIDLVVRAGEGKKDAGAKYVISPECEGDRPLYVPNYERVYQSEFILVPFGLIDSWVFEDLGFACMTGITGKNINPEAFRNINKRIFVIPDYGEEQAACKLVNQLGWKGTVLYLDYPENCKDPDEVRCLYGNDSLKTLLQNSLTKRHDYITI